VPELGTMRFDSVNAARSEKAAIWSWLKKLMKFLVR
jgi:hypothetical protein